MDNQSINPSETDIETGAEPTAEITFEKQEFFNWCDANDIDHATEGMDEKDRTAFEKIERHFTGAIKEKRLTVDGEKFVYTVSEKSPNAGEKFTVKPPNGRAMLAMDGFKGTNENQKLQAFIAAICGVEKRDISKISGLNIKDYRVLQDVAILFLTE